MTSGLLAHGTWIDDLAIPLAVAGVAVLAVLRASAGEPWCDGTCPYCGAPPGLILASVDPEDPTAPIRLRCGRCGFRLAARLSPSEAAGAASEEGTP